MIIESLPHWMGWEEEKGEDDRPLAITTDRHLITIPEWWAIGRLLCENENIIHVQKPDGFYFVDASIIVLTQPNVSLETITTKYKFQRNQPLQARYLDEGIKQRVDRIGIIQTRNVKPNET